MNRNFMLSVLVITCFANAERLPAFSQPGKGDPHRILFQKLTSGKPLDINYAHRHLSKAGKTDKDVCRRLAKIVWDGRYRFVTRYWALRTLSNVGPNAKVVLPDLVKAMNHPDDRLRVYGALGVLRSGGSSKDALKTLQKLTTSDRPFVPLNALYAIADAGPAAKGLIPYLTMFIDTAKDPTHREVAVQALGKMKSAGTACIPTLIKLIDHADKQMRREAAQSLSRLSVDCPQAYAGLLLVIERNVEGAQYAADALSHGGKKIVPHLVKILDGKNAAARAHAVNALRFMGRVATPAAKGLANAAVHATKDLEREFACETLGNIGKPAVPHLIGLIQNPKMRHRYHAINGLKRMGPDARETAPLLLSIMKNPNADSLDQTAAARALIAIGPGAEKLIPELIKLIPEKKTDVGVRSVRILAAIGPKAKAAVPYLIRAVTRKLRRNVYGRYVQQGEYGLPIEEEAALALGRFGKHAEKAIPLLIKILPTRHGRNAAQSLGRLGPPAKSALPELRKLFAAKTVNAKVESAVAVGRIDPTPDDAVTALVGWMNQSVGRVRRYERITYIRALGRIGPPAQNALKPLRALLDHETETSATAAYAILRIRPNDVQALDSLVKTLKTGNEAGKEAACRAVAQIGHSARIALPVLIKLARFDYGYGVRDASRVAIRAIDPSKEP